MRDSFVRRGRQYTIAPADERQRIAAEAAGINLGGPITDTIRLYGILGAERLEAAASFSVSTSFGNQSISVDDSATEAYYGVGAAFEIDENAAFRVRVLGHDSGDLITATIGFAFYF